MKISTKADGIKVILEMTEPEALSFARFVDAITGPSTYRFVAHDIFLESIGRDINNAISKARNELRA